MKRANIEVTSISIKESLEVTGAHDVKIICDKIFKDLDFSDFDMLIFIGGVKCVENVRKFDQIFEVINYFNSNNKYIAAICAAPVILGDAGVLDKNKFTCYEGFQDFVKNGIYLKQRVVQDKNIITSNCAGSVFEFGFKLVSILMGESKSNEVESRMIL